MPPTRDCDESDSWAGYHLRNALKINVARRLMVAVCVPLLLVGIIWCIPRSITTSATMACSRCITLGTPREEPRVWLVAAIWIIVFQWFWWGPRARGRHRPGNRPLSPRRGPRRRGKKFAVASVTPAALGALATLGDDPAVTWMNDPQAALPEPEPADPPTTGLADSGVHTRP